MSQEKKNEPQILHKSQMSGCSKAFQAQTADICITVKLSAVAEMQFFSALEFGRENDPRS